MAKFHPYARRELRVRFKQWVKGHVGLVAGLVVAVLVLVAFETWVMDRGLPDAPWKWYLVGVMHATAVAVVVVAICLVFLVHDGQAIWYLRGAWGEDATRDELERARRKKLIWGWVDSVTVQSGDIDHLVVTKAGGVVAIDSKWRTSPQQIDHREMAQEAKKARMRAQGVVQTLLRSGRGSHRASASSLTVTPVVVVWGAARTTLPEAATVDGIDFVAGDRLLEWLRRLEGHTVDEGSAADVLARLEMFRSKAWSSVTRS